MSDRELLALLERLRGGDRSALSAIYTELSTPIFTVIRRIAGNAALAEDLLQEVFLRLLRSPPGPDVHHPRAWIFRMARNLAIDCVRRPGMETLPEEQADGACPLEEAAAVRLDVEAGMRLLSDTERETVSMHLNGALTFREIAEITGRPLGTVLWRYHKAVGKLRAYLSGGDL